MELQETLDRLSELKNEIDAHRPISTELEHRIMQKFRLDWNYHSNNLEGNSLTFGETKSFLLHGITAEGKPLKDHLDIKGHNEAILLLDDVVKNNRPLTESFIRELHEIILHEPYDRPAITPDGIPTVRRIEIGQYKKTPNHVKTVTGETFYFASPEETPAKMNDLMDWYGNATAKNEIHPALIAAEFHYNFIRIHPFDDGNGRMARILMNLILMKYGYPPVIIKTGEKADYLRALQTADGGDITYFNNYIAEQLLDSLNLYLRGVRGESIEEADDVDKEIAMLKAELKDKSHKIIYDWSSSTEILNSSILPFIENLFTKLAQFDELFNKVSVQYKASAYGPGSIIDESITREAVIKSTVEYMTNYVHSHASIITEIDMIYKLQEFIKTDDKLFDVEVPFVITLNKFDFIVQMRFGPKQSFKVFYHNKNDEKKFQKITNEIAKYILKEIKEKLET